MPLQSIKERRISLWMDKGIETDKDDRFLLLTGDTLLPLSPRDYDL